jgi:hypothetical protein
MSVGSVIVHPPFESGAEHRNEGQQMLQNKGILILIRRARRRLPGIATAGSFLP